MDIYTIIDEECGCCGWNHRAGFYGDCRADSEGFMIVWDSDEPPATHFDDCGYGYASRQAFAEFEAFSLYPPGGGQ